MTRSPERTEFLSDIITTAVEGGTGYWAQVSQYQYVMDGEVCVCVGKRVGDGARAVLHPLLEDDSGYEVEGHEITPNVIAKGLGIVGTAGFGLNRDTRAAILLGNRENDAGEIDADGADAIVQAAIFGEVVYG